MFKALVLAAFAWALLRFLSAALRKSPLANVRGPKGRNFWTGMYLSHRRVRALTQHAFPGCLLDFFSGNGWDWHKQVMADCE
jgi:hypothetical protein